MTDRSLSDRASGRRIEIEGTVQGVGFRPWVYRLAAEHGVGGRVRNEAAGVVIDAFGSASALEAFTRELRRTPPPAARIRALRTAVIPGERPHGFVIDDSAAGSERAISIPPDLATCADCLAEILDPQNRRYRYAFTTCTDCGPRFTVSTDVPYDRAATTLSEFTMCADCRREYDTASDRRFHAEANACPACGPALMLLDREGRPVDADDPIDEIVRVLLAGGIAAIKGLGGFHLACDATSAAAVGRLRQRKRRDAKPFAVMVRDLREAEALALLTADERSVLSSNERPILLAEPSAVRQLAPNVAPDAPLVGLLLPYTPLHHLVVRQAQRPLVMTSGNRSEEPLAYRTDDAVSRLATIADVFLTHDRGIAAPCDDSVVRVIHGQATVLRRARGYVPRSIRVSPGFEEPVLACGALLKSTFCIGVGESAYLSTHIGDLENLASYDAFVAEVARMERFLGVTPGIVAHDLHPEYASVRYAASREAIKIGVQHHHAHVVSAMAEHGLSGPVIGVAYDGTGYGTDGRAWGGEVLIAWADRFERVSTLRPIRLPGGDAAIREPWRAALALIDDAFDGDPPIDALAAAGQSPHAGHRRRAATAGRIDPRARGTRRRPLFRRGRRARARQIPFPLRRATRARIERYRRVRRAAAVWLPDRPAVAAVDDRPARDGARDRPRSAGGCRRAGYVRAVSQHSRRGHRGSGP